MRASKRIATESRTVPVSFGRDTENPNILRVSASLWRKFLMKTPELVFGDILALLVTTLLGFITHGEVDLSFLPHFLALFVPLVIAWFLLAPWFGLFQQEISSSPRRFWRTVFAMAFVAPFAAVMRGLVLNTAILPIFVVVLAATSTIGMLLWRGLYFLLKIRLC
jgi:flagellar biosynthesis protein FliQ